MTHFAYAQYGARMAAVRQQREILEERKRTRDTEERVRKTQDDLLRYKEDQIESAYAAAIGNAKHAFLNVTCT